LDATIKRIEELRSRHVAAVEGGTEGRIELMRQQHLEHARSEAALRARGVKLHVVREQNTANQCPFYHQPKPLITCLSRSTNHTEPVCFGCPYPMEWASVKGSLVDYDHRTRPEQYTPYKMIRYINGAPTPVEHEPFVYMRVEEPNGDIWWFMRFLHGQVSPDYGAMMDHSRNDTRWWDLGASDMAPPQSSLPPEEVEAKREAADKKRRSMNKPSVKKKAKGAKGKRKPSDDE